VEGCGDGVYGLEARMSGGRTRVGGKGVVKDLERFWKGNSGAYGQGGVY
jgi:hypothetical protein